MIITLIPTLCFVCAAGKKQQTCINFDCLEYLSCVMLEYWHLQCTIDKTNLLHNQHLVSMNSLHTLSLCLWWHIQNVMIIMAFHQKQLFIAKISFPRWKIKSIKIFYETSSVYCFSFKPIKKLAIMYMHLVLGLHLPFTELYTLITLFPYINLHNM